MIKISVETACPACLEKIGQIDVDRTPEDDDTQYTVCGHCAHLFIVDYVGLCTREMNAEEKAFINEDSQRETAEAIRAEQKRVCDEHCPND